MLVNTMGLDIRWPIEIIFTIYGIALILYGVWTDPEIFQRSLGVNIDVGGRHRHMLFFGLFLTGLVGRASQRSRT
jgi:hypothetical protein